MTISKEDVDEILDVDEIELIKNKAIQKQTYKIAAYCVDRKKYLSSNDGLLFISKEMAKSRS